MIKNITVSKTIVRITLAIGIVITNAITKAKIYFFKLIYNTNHKNI